jgi:hypothetical protein
MFLIVFVSLEYQLNPHLKLKALFELRDGDTKKAQKALD